MQHPDNEAIACALCGTGPPAAGDATVAPLGWSTDVVAAAGGPRTRHTCPDCTRRNVRDIEAKLEQTWW